MKGVIIYKSRYGSTKQYAEWLRDETGFDLYDVKQAPGDLSSYDIVVIGSSVFAGRLALAGWIKKQWPSLQGKTVLLLMTHIRDNEQETANVVPQRLPAEIVERIKVFPVGGRYSLQRMGVMDKTLIKMVSSMEKNPQVKRELLAERDEVKKENLRGLLEYISGM